MFSLQFVLMVIRLLIDQILPVQNSSEKKYVVTWLFVDGKPF